MAGAGVLLVEDNPNDEELTCGVLSSHQLLCPVTVVRNGAEALDYLFAREAYAGREVTDLPLVVFLNLNLPKLRGIDVLRAIRADARTRLLTMAILTSSGEDVDLLAGYQNGANSYVVNR